MKCPHCTSDNIQSHVIVEDKKSRNSTIITGVFVASIILWSLIALAGDINMFLSIFAAVVLALPICLVLKIVLVFIPARQKIIFVCNNCGCEFDRYDLTDQYQNENSDIT